MNWKPYVTFALVGLFGHALGTEAFAQGEVVHSGGVTTLIMSDLEAQAGADAIDYENAQPMELPSLPAPSEAEAQADLINALIYSSTTGTPGSSPGRKGDGLRTPTRVPTSKALLSDELEVAPQEFGTSNHPFSTARADLSGHATNTFYPYRASGKLFFKDGTSSFVCSASLIKRGVVVTAAHCVAKFGARRFYTNIQFIPGYRNGVAPYGIWSGVPIVLTSYYVGTDPCSTSGVVCRNDVAVIRLTAKSGTYPGTSTGWYGYGWNGYGFTSGSLTHITQIGYPVCLDNGRYMERNDSHGFKSAAHTNNTIIGSLMCGGSSGGPWLVNFGVRPGLTGTTSGTAPGPNRVVGVTSWGYVNNAVKQQGASPFLSTNIVPLVNAACTAVPAACS